MHVEDVEGFWEFDAAVGHRKELLHGDDSNLAWLEFPAGNELPDEIGQARCVRPGGRGPSASP